MIHSHNNSEHERIMDTAKDIDNLAEDLFIEHVNGDEKLNRRIKRLIELKSELISQLKAHVTNTQPLDDIVKYNAIYKKIGLGLIMFASTVLSGVLINYFDLM